MIRISPITSNDVACRRCGRQATAYVNPDEGRPYPRWSLCDRCIAHWRDELTKWLERILTIAA